jgi:hypothetical protein
VEGAENTLNKIKKTGEGNGANTDPARTSKFLARTLSKDPEPMPAPLPSNRQSEDLEAWSCLRRRRGYRDSNVWLLGFFEPTFFFPSSSQPLVLLGLEESENGRGKKACYSGGGEDETETETDRLGTDETAQTAEHIRAGTRTEEDFMQEGP